MKKRGGAPQQQQSSFFKNTVRIEKIHAAILAGDREAFDSVIQDRKVPHLFPFPDNHNNWKNNSSFVC